MELIKPDTLLLDHRNIQYPEVPPQPPWDHRHLLGRRKDYWRGVAKVLWLVSSGFSLTKEIRELIVADEGANPQSGALLRLQPRLVDAGILRSELVKMGRYHSLRLVALGPNSEKLIKRLKWEPVESEWDRMLRLHEKGKEGEEKHTLSVIAFAYHSRLRGYKAGVMPAIEDNGLFAPDAVVVENGRIQKLREDNFTNLFNHGFHRFH